MIEGTEFSAVGFSYSVEQLSIIMAILRWPTQKGFTDKRTKGR